jgi:nucleoside-diphosphate-sugar epimerase
MNVMNAMNGSELHVIFGTGPVGKATMRELVKQGRRVRMVNRSGKADVPAGVEVVSADAFNPASAREAANGAAVVYQCAQPAYHDWVTKFPALQGSILEAAAAHGAKFIVCDNLYMYGDPNGQVIKEDSPYKAHTRKGRVRQAMAEAVMAAHKGGKVRAAIGRASDFIGPEYDVMADLVFYPALKGEAANLIGNTDVPHTFTYIPDFGKVLATLGLHDEALGQVWFTPSPEAITQRELVSRIYRAAGHEPKMRAAGKLILSAMGLFNSSMRETVEMLYEWEKPFVIDSSKFQRAFGIAPTSIDEAIQTSLDWCRANPPASKAS